MFNHVAYIAISTLALFLRSTDSMVQVCIVLVICTLILKSWFTYCYVPISNDYKVKGDYIMTKLEIIISNAENFNNVQNTIIIEN